MFINNNRTRPTRCPARHRPFRGMDTHRLDGPDDHRVRHGPSRRRSERRLIIESARQTSSRRSYLAGEMARHPQRRRRHLTQPPDSTGGKVENRTHTEDSVRGPGVPLASIEEFYWLHGGYFMVHTYETVFGDEPVQKGINYWFYHTDARKFRTIFFSNNGSLTEDERLTTVRSRTARSNVDRACRFPAPVPRCDWEDEEERRWQRPGPVVAARCRRAIQTLDEQRLHQNDVEAAEPLHAAPLRFSR